MLQGCTCGSQSIWCSAGHLVHQPLVSVGWLRIRSVLSLQSLSCLPALAQISMTGMHPVCSEPHCPLIYSVLHQSVSDGFSRDSIKRLANVKVNNIHCPPFIHQTSHVIADNSKSASPSLLEIIKKDLAMASATFFSSCGCILPGLTNLHIIALNVF